MLQMCPCGDLRDDAAIGAMLFKLAQDNVGQDTAIGMTTDAAVSSQLVSIPKTGPSGADAVVLKDVCGAVMRPSSFKLRQPVYTKGL